MKSFSAFSLSIGALACVFSIACSNSEEDVVPQMDTAKIAPAQNAEKAAEDEPQFVPMKALSDTKKQDKAAAPAASAPAFAPAAGGDIMPQSSGQYVIQVGIKPTKKAADAIVKKLAESNIKAYLAEVENPGELEGTFYRVRVGYFSSIANAQSFGKVALTSQGFDWWVDNRNNDQVGNSTTDYSNTNSRTYEEEEVVEEVVEEYKPQQQAEPAPAQEPEPAPAPAPEPEPVQEAAPAPEPAPAPAPAPAQDSDDDWE